MRFDALIFVCNYLVAYFPCARFRRWFYRRIMRVQLAPSAQILSGAWLDMRGGLVIGEGSIINQHCRLDSRGGLVIGAQVSISPDVQFITVDHDIQSADFSGRLRPVQIGDRVFVGVRATILPGVTIGEGAVVAACACVTRDVAPYTIVAGVPAKPIGERSRDLHYTMKMQRHFL